MKTSEAADTPALMGDVTFPTQVEPVVDSPVSDVAGVDAPIGGRWLAVAILFLLQIVSVLDRNVVTLLVAPIQRHFAISDVQVSLLLGAAFALPYGVLSLPLGWAVDRYPRRLIIAGGLSIWSAATAATGLVRSFPALYLARSSVGVGEAALIPAQSSLLGDLFTRREYALALSLSNLGIKVGEGVALLIGGTLAYFVALDRQIDLPLLGRIEGWQVVFLTVAAGGALLLPLIAYLPEPPRKSVVGAVGDETSFRTYFRFMSKRARFFAGHHFGFLLLTALVISIVAWTPAFFIRAHGWSEGRAGLAIGTAFLVGAITGMPSHGALASHLYRRGWTDIHLRYQLVATLLAAPVGVAAFLIRSPELAVVVLGLFMFLISCYASLPATALLAPLPSRFRGKASSVVLLFCGTGGAMAGPLAVGWLTEFGFADPRSLGYSLIVTIMICAPLVAGLFLVALKPLRELNAE